MSNQKPIIYESVDLIKIPVTLAGVQYFLQEASGDTAVKYRNAAVNCTKFKGGKPDSIANIGDIEPLLVSLCLTDEKGTRVPEKTIRSWPARLQKELFTRIKEISDLGEDEDSIEELEKKLTEAKERKAELGNESTNTEDGSS